MHIPSTKKVVCITGTVWTGSRSAPRRMLVREGFIRPTWFTTSRRITDANYFRTSITNFRLAKAKNNVLAHTRYGGSVVGIMQEFFDDAMNAAKQGVLIVGPPDIAAQVAEKVDQAIVFVLKDVQMGLSAKLDDAVRTGQLHRIDVDVLAPGAWTEVHRTMMDILGLP
jgi:hypothetical protein